MIIAALALFVAVAILVFLPDPDSSAPQIQRYRGTIVYVAEFKDDIQIDDGYLVYMYCPDHFMGEDPKEFWITDESIVSPEVEKALKNRSAGLEVRVNCYSIEVDLVEGHRVFPVLTMESVQELEE